MSHRSIIVVLLMLVALTGCRIPLGTTTVDALADEVEVVGLVPAANGAMRYEASLRADTRYSREDHAAALLVAATRGHCAGEGLVITSTSDNFVDGAREVDAGEQLVLAFECPADMSAGAGP